MISRPLKEGFRGVARHWGMSISASIAVTITLVMISLFMIFSFNLENFTKDIESSLEISVLVDYDYESKEQIDRIDSELNAITGVAEVTFSLNPGVLIQYSTICSAVGFDFERIQLQPDDARIAEYPYSSKMVSHF